MLIDTGANSADSFGHLARVMSEVGVEPTSLKHIVLTHLHSDHCGLAAQLRDMSGATVWMHRADADLLMQLKTSREHFDMLEAAMREAGTPDSLRGSVLAAYDRLLATFPTLSPNAYLEDGAELESWLGPLQVVWTPGHSPGLCCLYNPTHRYLFSSDHVIEDITPHVGWLAGEDMLGDYLDSLDRLDPLDVQLILPAHGATFSGLREWTAATREHHQGRSREIEQHQRDGLLLADDLVRRLWPRELRPLDYQLALTEVLAHLEHARR
jgi:glyoxylase-like metal-dependent hydrolase (beta-lactamase superfamily II)